MKKEYKELFNEIVPGDDINKKVLSMAENKKRLMFSPKKIIAAVAVFAVAVAGSFGIYYVSSDRYSDSRNPQSSSASSDFSIVAYAQDNPDNIITISNDDVELMDLKISLNQGSDGYYVSASSDDNGITVRAEEEIESVTFESNNGTFTYVDGLLKNSLVKQKKYYSAVIPISQQQFNEYNAQIAASDGKNSSEIKQNFVSELIGSQDCSAYIYDDSFDVSKISTYEYSCYASDMAGEDENYYDYCILIVDKDKNQNLLQMNQKKVVAKTYQPGEEIGYVSYWPDEAIGFLLNNPDAEFGELPTDSIKITVKFKNGQTAIKEIVTDFTNDGMLTMKFK